MKVSTFALPLQAPHQIAGMRPNFTVNDFEWKTILDDEAGSSITISISQFAGMRAYFDAQRPEFLPPIAEKGRITSFYKNTLEELLSVLSEHLPLDLFTQLIADLDLLGLEAAYAWRDNWLVGKFGLSDLELDELKLQLQSDAHR